MDVNIRNKFIEIEYGFCTELVILVTYYRKPSISSEFWNYLGIDDVTDISLNVLSKSIKSIPLLMKVI